VLSPNNDTSGVLRRMFTLDNRVLNTVTCMQSPPSRFHRPLYRLRAIGSPARSHGVACLPHVQQSAVGRLPSRVQRRCRCSGRCVSVHVRLSSCSKPGRTRDVTLPRDRQNGACTCLERGTMTPGPADPSSTNADITFASAIDQRCLLLSPSFSSLPLSLSLSLLAEWHGQRFSRSI